MICRRCEVCVALKQCAVLNGKQNIFFNAKIHKAGGNTGGRLDLMIIFDEVLQDEAETTV